MAPRALRDASGTRGDPKVNETLSLLQTKCSTTLRAYLELAKDGCELLSRLNDVPLPENKRNEVLAHRRRELHAHTDYTKARSKLWEFLNQI
jgi:hypothetical protein